MKSWFTEEDSLSSTTKNIYLYFSLQIWGFQIIYLDIIRQSNMQKTFSNPQMHLSSFHCTFWVIETEFYKCYLNYTCP